MLECSCIGSGPHVTGCTAPDICAQAQASAHLIHQTCPVPQVHTPVHFPGHSGAYSNHSGGAYNSGASGGQPSVGPHQGNFGYDTQGHGPGGHYPSDVPASSNAAMLRGPLDDVWPAPNQHGVSQGQVRVLRHAYMPTHGKCRMHAWLLAWRSITSQRFWVRLGAA